MSGRRCQPRIESQAVARPGPLLRNNARWRACIARHAQCGRHPQGSWPVDDFLATYNRDGGVRAHPVRSECAQRVLRCLADATAVSKIARGACRVTDQELIAKRLAFIETCLCDLRRQAQPDRLSTDLRELRFVEHTLQIAIQAALDVASHIVSDNRLGEPRTNRELFDLLALLIEFRTEPARREEARPRRAPREDTRRI
jgi:Protein of unknown function DUF86